MIAVNLVSGGVDSYIMSQEHDGVNVYVNFGQRYANEEMAALDRLGVEYDVVNLSKPNASFGDIFIPARNLMLASMAVAMYDADVVRMAGLRDDNCIDKTEAEFKSMSEILSRQSGHKVTVMSPYWQKSKGEIVHLFQGDRKKLQDTFSCYKPVDGHQCGNCPACLRKAIALETNGVEAGYEVSKDVIGEYMGKIHTYDRDRVSRFFIYLKRHGMQVHAVDIDGVLCSEGGSYEDRKKISFDMPNDGVIVLYTARLECDREITERWLADNGVRYDALIMHKLPYTDMIDDNARRLECTE